MLLLEAAVDRTSQTSNKLVAIVANLVFSVCCLELKVDAHSELFEGSATTSNFIRVYIQRCLLVVHTTPILADSAKSSYGPSLFVH